MHICYLTNEYPNKGKAHGGIGSFVYTIAHELVKSGISVSVLGLYNIKNEEIQIEDGITIIRLPISRIKYGSFVFNSIAINRKLWDLYNSNDSIDIIEGSELSFAFIDKKLPCKKIIRMHGGHHFFAHTLGKKISRWKAWQEKKSFKKADFVCAVSKYVATTTASLLQLKKNIEVIYNTIDVSEFYKADQLKVQNGKILFIGTVCEKKGIKQLLKAMRYVIKEYPHVKLEIVGRDWSSVKCTSYIEYLKKQVLDKNLAQHVTFSGNVSHNILPNLIESAELCVFPSLMESWGIVVLEGMSMGKPVIFMSFGPGPEIIENNVTGILCNTYSSSEIAEKIIYALENPEVMQRMGEAARKDVLERFDVVRLVKNNIFFMNHVSKIADDIHHYHSCVAQTELQGRNWRLCSVY